MAGLIKSAISKQKEYLADASAVQFTRTPGHCDALKIIGGHSAGTFVETARAEEMSTCFSASFMECLRDPSPIEERIERIDPQGRAIYHRDYPDRLGGGSRQRPGASGRRCRSGRDARCGRERATRCHCCSHGPG